MPPTGAKGLNLAVADVRVLAAALRDLFAAGDDAGLRAYSDTCLRRVWRAEHFSWWMTSMLHRFPDGDGLRGEAPALAARVRRRLGGGGDDAGGELRRAGDGMGGLILPPPYADDAAARPALDHAAYRSTALRHPSQPLIAVPQTLTELTGPLLGEGRVRPTDADLTIQHEGEPLGERIIVHGRVLEQAGRPVRDTLVELWQATAAGATGTTATAIRRRSTRTSPAPAAA